VISRTCTATYTPFGGVHVSSGTLPTNRFPGQWFQSESGLHQNWMRDYDPTTGRYLQADPLGLVDGASVYGYVKQNPGRWIDPRGEYKVCYTDAKTGKQRCVEAYCPGGDCGWRNPIENNREYDACTEDCWVSSPEAIACLAIGVNVGIATRCGPLTSAPTNYLCRKLMTYNCMRACESASTSP
jgi:RHS repeat-associated protein